MGNDVTKRVATEFTVEDRATSAVGALSSTFSGIGSMITSITSRLTPLNVGIASLMGVLSGGAVMKAGSDFEGLQNGLAQTLQFMGQGGANFQTALEASAATMKQIVAEAGPLPGNAMDYASALQLAGASTQRATGDFQKAYDLIKSTTAVSISMKGSAELGAVSLNRMLDSNRGLMEQVGDFNQKMLNSMRQLPGMANLTTAEFNKFTLDKRLDLVTRGMAQFDDMVKSASTSWDAVKGAVEATQNLFVKEATAPLFEGAKHAMSAINASIIAADGNWTPFGQKLVTAGQIISSTIVDGADRAADAFLRLGEVASGAFDRLQHTGFFGVLDQAVGKLEGVFEMAQENPQGAAGMVGAGAAAMGGAGAGGALMIGGLFDFLARGNEAVDRFGAGLVTSMGLVLQVFDPFMSLFSAMTSAVGDFYEGVLPGLVDGVNMLLGPLVDLTTGVFGIYQAFVGALQPALMGLWSAVGNLVEGMGAFLGPVVRILGAGILYVYDLMANSFAPILSTAADAVGGLINAIGSFLKWLGGLLGPLADKLMPPSTKTEGPPSALGEFMSKFRDAFKGMGDAMKPGGMLAHAKPPGLEAGHTAARGGGGRAVQDFRFSRFEITQKFAEGFDPDRIALSFAADLGKLGEKKLESGFAPIFGLR